MKYLAILCITLLTNLRGQTTLDNLIETIPAYKSKDYIWTDQQSEPKNFKSLVHTIFKDSLNAFCSDLDSIPDFKKFHVIDIDKDKDLDIVFQGKECEGFESQTVLIYLNVEGKYKRILNSNGKILFLNCGSELVIYEYPCCAMTENSFALYSISKDNIHFNSGVTFFDSFVLHLKEQAESRNYDLILPKQLKLSGQFTVKENAIFNYVPLDTIIRGRFIKDNFLASSLRQTPVKVFASYEDKKGIKWFYCKVSNLDLRSHEKTFKYPLLLWVRQTYRD